MATRKTKNRNKRLRRGALLFVAVFLFAAVCSAGWYAAGGSWERLRERGAAVQGALGSIVDRADTLIAQVTVGGQPGEGDIQVYFGPTTPANPAGIDDHLVALIGRAEERVHAAFYDLELESVAGALIAQHEAGVEVAVVSDSHYEHRPAMRAIREAGIPVVFDRREPFMHNKFCVVDGAYVWTGSMNVTRNGAYRNNNNALLLASPELAVNYTDEFLEMFEERAFGARSPRNTTHPVLTIGQSRVECYFAPEDGVEEVIVARVSGADTRIDFMAFSFTSVPIAEAMASRIASGVTVRGLFEHRNAGSRYSRDDYLLAAGAEVFLDTNPDSMHHKVIIIDENIVITGSYNFSAAANMKNDENCLIVHDKGIAQLFSREFEALVSEAKRPDAV